jgi:5'-nucleotidase (lipoprotein e(P4) family)
MNKSFLFSLVLSVAIILTSCQAPVNKPIPANLANATLYATLYQQQASEYKALCFQAFNLASLRLEEELLLKKSKPLAIVVDIDETVLDNSPYQAASIIGNFNYPIQWSEWMYSASAEAVPGAQEFLSYAAAKKVEVFYITNRKEEFKQATIKNLNETNFPFADSIHVMTRTTSNDKEERRQQVLAKYDIVLFVGDNLGDFNSIFDETDASVRTTQTIENRKEFGKRWIVLPNACYGTWLNALPGYSNKISTDSLMIILKNNLKGF